MRTLPEPDICAKTVYLTCISKVRSQILKRKLTTLSDTIDRDAQNYDSVSQSREWYLFSECECVSDHINVSELEKVYTQRMAKIDSPGRQYYDQIKGKSEFNICPLCGQRQVEQLDHYLPQSQFHTLIVLPINLIPSCEKCNKAKRNLVPNTATEQTLHPYFDDVSSHQWLFAEVEVSSPVSIRFYVADVMTYDDELNDRIKYHFETLKLASLYASQSGAFIADIRHRLIDLHAKGGKSEVQKYLVEEEETRHKRYVNSWQRSLFQALAASDWFCDGGFES